MRPTARHALAALLVLVATILLLVSSFLAWYSFSYSTQVVGAGGPYTVSTTESYYPGSHWQIGLGCSAPSTNNSSFFGCDFAYGLILPYSGEVDPYSGPLNQTGHLYSAVESLVIADVAAGFAAAGSAVLALLGRGPRRILPALLIVATLALAVAAPLSVAVFQTPAFSADAQGRVTGSAGLNFNNSSPANSFVGSCSGSGCLSSGNQSGTDSTSANWGPAAGWYLAAVSSLLLAAGLALWLTRRVREPDVTPPGSQLDLPTVHLGPASDAIPPTRLDDSWPPPPPPSLRP